MVRITSKQRTTTADPASTLRLAAVDDRNERMQVRIAELDVVYTQEMKRLAKIVKKAQHAVTL